MLHYQSVIVLMMMSIDEEWLAVAVLARRRRLLSLLLSLSVSQFSLGPSIVYIIPRRAGPSIVQIRRVSCLARFRQPRRSRRGRTPLFPEALSDTLALFRSILDRGNGCVAPIPRWSSNLVSFVG